MQVLNKTASYVEWAPPPALADRVVCLWRDPVRPYRPPVLPDACIDIVWDGRELGVAGPDTHGVTESDATFEGVRFRPGAAPGMLGVSADELLDRRVALSDRTDSNRQRAWLSNLALYVTPHVKQMFA